MTIAELTISVCLTDLAAKALSDKDIERICSVAAEVELDEILRNHIYAALPQHEMVVYVRAES